MRKIQTKESKNTQEKIIENDNINWQKLEGMCFYDAALSVCAKQLGVSHDTIERAIRKKFNWTFAEYKKDIMLDTRLRLISKAISMALSGDRTMLIFTLKNIAGWGDVVKNENTTTIEVKQDLSGEKTDELIKKAQDLAERLENKRRQKQEPIQK
jgi:hypothetical protein